MSLSNKRNLYKQQMTGAESLSPDQTIITAIIDRVKTKMTSKNKSFYTIQAVHLSNDKTFIKAKNAKRDDGDSPAVKRVKTEDGGEEETAPAPFKGFVLEPFQRIMGNCFDASGKDLATGMVVKLVVSADMYDGREQTRIARIILDKDSNRLLTNEFYRDVVSKSPLAEIPSVENMDPSTFPEGTDEKYMKRMFVLPLAKDPTETVFSNVEIQLDDRDQGRLFCKDMEDPKITYVGLNMDNGDKTSNSMAVVYTHAKGPDDVAVKKTLMRYAYKHDVWSCFGITSVNLWGACCPRLIFYGVDWYAFGSTGYDRLTSLRANIDGDTDPDDEGVIWNYSTGFINNMNIDMGKTVAAAGIPLSTEFVQNMFTDEYENPSGTHTGQHPMNENYRRRLTLGRGSVCVNLTELDKIDIDIVVGIANKFAEDKKPVRFYGVFDMKSDAPYEIAAESDEAREAELVKNGYKPAVVFAVR